MTLFETIQTRNVNVLFVCVGNACRSQMAEAFANTYGNDVLDASSAGLFPATRLSNSMLEAMAEKGIEVENERPRRVNSIDLIGFDLIVNLSGYALPNTSAEVIKFSVADPAGKDGRFHSETRDRIEEFVESLVAQFRQARGVERENRRSVLPLRRAA